MRRLISLFGVVLLMAQNVFAGYVLTYHRDQFTSDGVKTSCVETDYINAPKMRIETLCKDAGAPPLPTVTIFRGDKNLIWKMDPATRRYQEMTRADVQKSRASYEDAIRSTGGHSFKPTGETQKVKDWTCTVYQHVFHSSLADEYCIVEGNQVFKGADEAETAKRHLLAALDPDLIDPDEQNQLANLAMGKTRFTLKHTNILLDQPTFTLEFVDGHSSPFPASQFELPAGARQNP